MRLNKCRLETGLVLFRRPRIAALKAATRQDLSGILLHVDDFTAFVEPALGTDAVLHARLLTIRTDDGLRCPQRIVRPAFTAARF